MDKNILIVAGEASGDMHGASLIHELKKTSPEFRFTGIGGNKMKAEGMHLLYHINQMAFLGFAEVIKHLPFIQEVKKNLIEEVVRRNIRTVVLIDYPGFNLNIAKKLKALGVKIIYYISPQVWAWGKGRISKMQALIDELIVILPFEERFFSEYGIPVHYVGHPLISQMSSYNYMERGEFFSKHGLDEKKRILLLLPGSRNQEVKRIFTESIEAANKIAGEFNMQIVVACAGDIDESLFGRLNPGGIKYKVIKGQTYELFRYSAAGIIKSGTSTLEAGLSGLPMVVVYSTSPVTYFLGRLLVKIQMIALVNIVLGQKVVPELIQGDVNRRTIYQECRKLLTDISLIRSMKSKYEYLGILLGKENASEKAAEIIIKNFV